MNSQANILTTISTAVAGLILAGYGLTLVLHVAAGF